MTHKQFLSELTAIVKREGGQSAFARKHGISRQRVNEILHGREMPSRTLLKDIGWTMHRESVYTFEKK